MYMRGWPAQTPCQLKTRDVIERLIDPIRQLGSLALLEQALVLGGMMVHMAHLSQN